eukprot:COSAG01_NODE_122_length_25212_cov_25.945646_3_plen_110_part_00
MGVGAAADGAMGEPEALARRLRLAWVHARVTAIEPSREPAAAEGGGEEEQGPLLKVHSAPLALHYRLCGDGGGEEHADDDVLGQWLSGRTVVATLNRSGRGIADIQMRG